VQRYVTISLDRAEGQNKDGLCKDYLCIRMPKV
jgi:hypothetical protein